MIPGLGPVLAAGPVVAWIESSSPPFRHLAKGKCTQESNVLARIAKTSQQNLM